MNKIKKILKNSTILATSIFIIGLLTFNIYVILIFIGACVSILSFYMMIQDAKLISYAETTKQGTKIARLGFAKRFFLYLIALGIAGYFYKEKGIFCVGIGMLNIKINIYLLTLYERLILKINKIKEDSKKWD